MLLFNAKLRFTFSFINIIEIKWSLSCEIFELKKKKGLRRTNPSPKTTSLMYESTSNSRKSLKDDFLRASVVAVAVAQMTAKVLEYWRGRRELFPRLSRSLPLPSSRKRDLLKVARRLAPFGSRQRTVEMSTFRVHKYATLWGIPPA